MVETFPKAHCIRIFSRSTNIAPLQEVWRSTGDQVPLSVADERVLGSCDKEKRSILVEDSTRHKLLKGIEQEKAGSILCCPILDEMRFLKGLIYLTAQEPKAFNTHGRFACERISKDVGRALDRANELVPESSDAEDSPRLSPAVMGVSLFVVFLVGALVFASVRRGAEPVSVPTRVSSTRTSRDMAQELVRRLKVGEYGAVWEMFSPELQSRWPRRDFEAALSDWSKTESNQEAMLKRRLAGVKEEDGVEVAVLYGTSSETDPTEWNWGIGRHGEEWKVLWFRGGPVASPGAP